MVHIALAGASGSLGKLLLNHLSAHPSAHRITVLSRSPTPPKHTNPNITVRTVDYTSLSSLTEALAGVHTVISTLSSLSSGPAQILLIQAAAAAGVKRFAPSEWSIHPDLNYDLTLYTDIKAPSWEAVKASGMQYTALESGVFLNYMAYGSPKPGAREKAFKGLQYTPWIFDPTLDTIEVPGTGEERFAVTEVEDVARVVADVVGRDEVWQVEVSTVVGAVTCFNELIREMERITGKKYKVVYQDIPLLERRIAEETTQMGRFYWEYRLCLARGKGNVQPTLNKLTDLKLTGVSEFLETWWGK
ncbi:uncharacterized protein H6S33_012236 [Morchella sextelata]|uniref:uncharacterized protein n=1 Tax=Morchella sextelata TaxID=1174677 RepID=UPI001D0569E8|nr:uncharacterized protein H6S33_012236 [Morchella sextelata]KAH0610709.1 hypothetical protein H6S33_012236 [Morchella sextelata]